MVTCTLSPGFGGSPAGKAVSGRTPSGLYPISRTMESAVTAITVASRPCVPGSFLRAWLCSYSEKISLKDSTGSLATAGFGADGLAAFASDIVGSEVPGLDVSGLNMKRLKPLRHDLA